MAVGRKYNMIQEMLFVQNVYLIWLILFSFVVRIRRTIDDINEQLEELKYESEDLQN